MIKIDSQFLNPFIRRLTRARVCLRIENLLLQNVFKLRDTIQQCIESFYKYEDIYIKRLTL